jgi:hypothetical protein
MTDIRTRFSTTPRLFVVGLFILGAACHHKPPASVPAPTAPAPVAAPAPAALVIRSGPTLIQAMHDRYASGWYHTLTFTQKTTLGLPSGGDVVQTWYEALKIPGRQRIDSDLAAKAGVLFAHDSIHNFSGGKLVHADSGSNELLVLGFDVYGQSVARSETLLRGLGFDLSRFHEATWQGTPVYVVGALRADTTSKQFWVERDRLLLVRTLENARQGHTDVRFGKYVSSGGGWVATEVTQTVNGKRRILEQLSDVRANASVSDALFDPKQWATVPHWASR